MIHMLIMTIGIIALVHQSDKALKKGATTESVHLLLYLIIYMLGIIAIAVAF